MVDLRAKIKIDGTDEALKAVQRVSKGAKEAQKIIESVGKKRGRASSEFLSEEFNKRSLAAMYLKQLKDARKEFGAEGNLLFPNAQLKKMSMALAGKEISDSKKLDEGLRKQEEKKIRDEEKEKERINKIQQNRDYKEYVERGKFLTQQKKNEEKKRKEEEKFNKERRLKGFLGLGIAGIGLGIGLRMANKAFKFLNREAQEMLGYQRTIEGGAAGGAFFGQQLSAYQRAGIGGAQYKNFKQGLQGYIGSVKLGMGDASPLIYLGLGALENLDTLETELIDRLKSLPPDIAIALGQQMGLSYDMIVAARTGKLDPTARSVYSEEVFKKWAELADKFNNFLTDLDIFFKTYVISALEWIKDMKDRFDRGVLGSFLKSDIGGTASMQAVNAVDLTARGLIGQLSTGSGLFKNRWNARAVANNVTVNINGKVSSQSEAKELGTTVGNTISDVLDQQNSETYFQFSETP